MRELQSERFEWKQMMMKAQQNGDFDPEEHYFKMGKRILIDKMLVAFYHDINLTQAKGYVLNRLKLLNGEFQELIKCMKDGEVDVPPIPPLEVPAS